MRTAKILLFFIFLFQIVRLQAQTNFVKGYYVTTANDTIHGYIDYRLEKRNYKLCVFKQEIDSKAIRLYPQDIVGFVVDDKEFYEKQSFKSRRGEELYGFFKVLVRGELSLLRYQSRYFAKNKKGDVFEISKRSDISDGKIRQDYYGLGILKVLMKDCEDISGSFLEKEYKSGSNFTHIFLKFNTCVGSASYEPQKIVIKPHLALGVQASSGISKLSLSAGLEDADFGNSFSLSAGGFSSIFIPKVDENIRLVFEAAYSKYNQYAYFRSSNTTNDLFIKYSSVEVPILIRYSLNKVFFDFGIQSQYILKQDLRWRVETVQQSTIYTKDEEVASFKGWSSGYLAGIGLKYTLADYVLRTSLRYSQLQLSNHPNTPAFQKFELNLSIQLTK